MQREGVYLEITTMDELETKSIKYYIQEYDWGNSTLDEAVAKIEALFKAQLLELIGEFQEISELHKDCNRDSGDYCEAQVDYVNKIGVLRQKISGK